MTRVAVIGPSGIAGPVGAVLRDSPAVEVDAGGVGNGIDTLVYAPWSRTPNGMKPDITEATAVLESAAGAGVRRAVLVSSGAIYRAWPHNIGLLPETIEPAIRSGSAIAEGWNAVEALTRTHFAGESLTILRPSSVLEPDSCFGRLLSSALAVSLPGHDPAIQLLDVDDLARAVRRVVEGGATGVYHRSARPDPPAHSASTGALPLCTSPDPTAGVAVGRVMARPGPAVRLPSVHTVLMDAVRQGDRARARLHGSVF